MEMTLIKKEYKKADSIDHFMDFYYSLQMRHLASDLLYKGLSPDHIKDAVARAIKAGKSSGIDIRKHFMPVFSGIEKEIISDCKLSKLAYGLVLMNADAQLPLVGRWQVRVLEEYFLKT